MPGPVLLSLIGTLPGRSVLLPFSLYKWGSWSLERSARVYSGAKLCGLMSLPLTLWVSGCCCCHCPRGTAGEWWAGHGCPETEMSDTQCLSSWISQTGWQGRDRNLRYWSPVSRTGEDVNLSLVTCYMVPLTWVPRRHSRYVLNLTLLTLTGSPLPFHFSPTLSSWSHCLGDRNPPQEGPSFPQLGAN